MFSICYVVIFKAEELQLTFEQNGFELPGSTYMWIFFLFVSVVNTAVLLVLGLVESSEVELQIGGNSV